MSDAKSPREMLERAAKFGTKLDTINIEGADLSGAKLSRLQADFMNASIAQDGGRSPTNLSGATPTLRSAS